jgi:hypothetical protein
MYQLSRLAIVPFTPVTAHLGSHGIPVELVPLKRAGTRGLGKSAPDGSLLNFVC